MKLHIKLVTLAVASFALIGTAAQAQFVKGNEAVKVTATGTKVETPPAQAPYWKAMRCRRELSRRLLGAWSRPMLGSSSALSHARDQARVGASTYGTQKLSRAVGGEARRRVAAMPVPGPRQQVRSHVRAATSEPAARRDPVAATGAAMFTWLGTKLDGSS